MLKSNGAHKHSPLARQSFTYLGAARSLGVPKCEADDDEEDLSFDEEGDSDEEGSDFSVTPVSTPDPIRRKRLEQTNLVEQVQAEISERQNYKDTEVYQKFKEIFPQKASASTAKDSNSLAPSDNHSVHRQVVPQPNSDTETEEEMLGLLGQSIDREAEKEQIRKKERELEEEILEMLRERQRNK